MREALIIISSLVSIGAIIPYLLDIVRNKTKPRVGTWFTWTLLSGITSAAAFADGQYPAAILTLCGATGTLLVVILGWRHGDKRLDRVDAACQIGALIGLGLWLAYGTPALAVIATTVIDLIATVPTQVHAWRAPKEETAATFAYDLVAAVCTLAATTSWRLTAILPPSYLFLSNGSILLIILTRRRYAANRITS